VDAGNGQVALWCEAHNRFVRMNDGSDMDASDHKGRDELPSGWTWERFTVAMLRTPGPYEGQPTSLAVGSVVGLHAWVHNRFVRMRDNYDMDASTLRNVHEMPTDWTWEPFHVVDGGDGKIALWNEVHRRFVRMKDDGWFDGGAGEKGKDELPGDWTWERFEVVPAGDSQIALWNEANGKFMRMTDNNEIDASDSKGRDELPDNWSWERFQVVTLVQAPVGPPPYTGNTPNPDA
jgi:hypothetical protein